MRHTASACILAILLTAATPSAMAADVRLGTRLNAGDGSDVVVPIAVDPAVGVQSVDLTIDYDPAVLTPTGAFLSDATGDFVLGFDATTPGVILLSLAGPALTSTSVERLGSVAFEAFGDDGTDTTLTLSTAVLNQGAIVAEPENGRVTIREGEFFCLGGTNNGDVCVVDGDCPGCYAGPNNGAPCTSDVDCPQGACGGSCRVSRAFTIENEFEGPPGSTILVPVTVDDTEGAESFDLIVEYNPDVVNALDVEKTPLSQSMSLSSFLGISGEVRISMFASSSLPGAAGDVLQIEFEFVGPPGSRSPLALARSWINERQAPASFDDGFVAVCSGADADTDGFSSCDGDCDDAAPDRFPGNPEICDGLDNDCDLTLPPDEIDADEDGLSECEGDCDPLDPTNAPAPAVGDSLRGDRSASTIELTWDAEGIAGTYAVHRGVLLPTASFSYNHACLIDGLIDAEAFDADVPDPGGGFYYLVSREDPCGESGLGEDGDGTARPGGTACP